MCDERRANDRRVSDGPCRWSTDLGRCDIYAYADVAGGFTVRVAAAARSILADWFGPRSKDVLDGKIHAAEWADKANAMYREISHLPLNDIDAPSAENRSTSRRSAT